MSEPLFVLPVQYPDARNMANGQRQLSRCFPCREQDIGRWVAIQGTTLGSEQREDRRFKTPAEWAIVAVGKLTGCGYYPGFIRDRQGGFGQAYKRATGQAGPWIWGFTNLTKLDPVGLSQLPRMDGRVEVCGNLWTWADNGHGDWWSACLRELSPGTVERVRKARRKAK